MVEYRGSIYRDDTSLREWLSLGEGEPVLEPGLPIVDAHHHLWDSRWGTYMLPDYLSDLSEGHNFVATVYAEAGAMYRAHGEERFRPIGEIEFARGVAAMADSGRYGATRIAAGIIGAADLLLGAAVRDVLEAGIEAGGGRLKGIRYSVPWDEEDAVCTYLAHYVPPRLLLDSTFREGFAELAPLGLSYDVWLLHPQLPDLVDLARSFPGTSIVLDHLGSVLGVGRFAGKREETFANWRIDMAALARCPNVSVKLGGLGMTQSGFGFHLTDRPATSVQLAEAWRPYIETCIELFGADRCMFESNAPPDLQSSGITELWNAFKRITAAASSLEKRALFAGTAARIYRLDLAI